MPTVVHQTSLGATTLLPTSRAAPIGTGVISTQRISTDPFFSADATITNILAGASYELSYAIDDTVIQSGEAASTEFDVTSIAVSNIPEILNLVARSYGKSTYNVASAHSRTGLTIYVSQVADSFITEAVEATVAAYTGIDVNYTTKVITVTETHTVNAIYDYLNYSDSLIANIAQPETLTTINGTTLTLETDWDLVVSGSGVVVENPAKTVVFSGTGVLTVASGGRFEDAASGLVFETGGSVYYGRHIYRNVKDSTTSSNQQYAVAGCWDTDNDIDVTYSTTLVNGGLTTDASGNAEGYYVYKKDSTTYTTTEYIGLYGFGWSLVPIDASPVSVGTTSAYSIIRLTTDANVTLSRTAALAISGVTATAGTDVIDFNSNTFSQVNDNIKARQASASDVESGKAGYVSYYEEGDIFASDGTLYNLNTAWTAQNIVDTVATLKGGTVEIGTAGDIDFNFEDVTLDYTPASGTFDHRGETMDGTITLVNSGGGSITVQVDAGVTIVNTGPNITLDQGTVATGLSFSGLIATSQVIVFETGTQTVIDSVESSGATFEWSEVYSSPQTVDYTIINEGYLPIRVTGVIAGSGLTAVAISQTIDRAYVASSGLAFGSTATVNTGTSRFTVTTASTVQNWYSFMKESWRDESTLKNVAFPISANGPNSFTLAAWEFASGISNLSQDGLRYVDASEVVLATWSAILSVGEATGLQVRYQQVDGSGTADAAATGVINELIQVYGDATHGNFDYTGHLVLKVQADGYDEATANVFATYGTLEDQLYVVGLAPLSNGLATGDPSVTSVTITDHGASPVTWNGKSFSLTITDSAGTNTGTDLMRWLRFNFDAGGAFQSKDGFDWHDLIQKNGSNFKTVNGVIYGDTGSVLKGVRVVQNDGSTAHADFDVFTADDGTTYEPPAIADISVTGMPTTGAAIRLQIINETARTSSAWVASTAYSVGDIVLRTTGVGSESTEGLFFRCTTAGTSNDTEPTWDTTPTNTTADTAGTGAGDVVWTTYNIQYYSADPASDTYTPTYYNGEEFRTGETVRLRFAELDGGTTFKIFAQNTVAATAGWSMVVAVESDSVYATNGVDGSTVTKFTADYTNDEIDLSVASNFTAAEAYAFFCSTLTSADGVSQFWGGVEAADVGNYKIVTALLSLYFDNTTTATQRQTDTARIYRDDSVYPVKDPTTSTFGIDINWKNVVYVVSTGGSALTPTESAYLLGLPEAAAIADAVLNEDVTEHTAADSLSQTLQDAADSAELASL